MTKDEAQKQTAAALAEQKAAHEEEVAKAIESHEAALAEQKAAHEEEVAKAIESHEAALEEQKAAHEEEMAKVIESHGAALEEQKAAQTLKPKSGLTRVSVKTDSPKRRRYPAAGFVFTPEAKTVELDDAKLAFVKSVPFLVVKKAKG